ncbi:hypothetical protein [Novipirellula artificiosorum]|uniref:Uncharacterized protein n=1 Tax=Novipirellula artificiosorum TaxID=2528016 RepID=A0A5C6E064_9BACT|nr:hypothetical protein [Novipirellula artificiosorum]TWU42288.1 hypothetical protein Poly41_05840 [Novipirellula artificiosorum]
MLRFPLYWRNFANKPLATAPRILRWALLAGSTLFTIGCDQPDPIVTYSIPTDVPAQFRAGTDRRLGAMFPVADQTWFFKVTGPEKAIGGIADEFRSFVQSIEFSDGAPDLGQLPEGWRLGGEKPMRFASIDVNTPEKQLDISVSSLPKQDDWDAEVVMNVNRWRTQLGLDPSNEKWAGGEAIEIDTADGPAVWVDLLAKATGEDVAAAPSMMGQMPQDAIHSGLQTPPSGSSGSLSAASPAPQSESKLKYDKPEGWRDGRMSTMRLAAFNVGPEDAEAEITIIAAGGDLRGNVVRWLGQIRPSGVSDQVVDQAIEDAETIEVDGRKSQRFLLLGEDPASGTAIDATIVPLEDNFSMFIKMTGPVQTVRDQSDQTKAFIESLQF